MSSLSLQSRKTTQPSQGGICTGFFLWLAVSLPLFLSLSRSTWTSYKLLAISLMNLQLLWLLSTVGHFTLLLSLSASSLLPLQLAALPCQLTVKCFSKLACHTEAAAWESRIWAGIIIGSHISCAQEGHAGRSHNLCWSTLKMGYLCVEIIISMMCWHTRLLFEVSWYY